MKVVTYKMMMERAIKMRRKETIPAKDFSRRSLARTFECRLTLYDGGEYAGKRKAEEDKGKGIGCEREEGWKGYIIQKGRRQN